MKKVIVFSLLLAPVFYSAAQTEEVSSCIQTTGAENCSGYYSSVTIENVKNTLCNKGSLKITVNKLIETLLQGNEKISITATNNQTGKVYSLEIKGPTETNKDPFVGIISGLPKGTYTVTTKDIIEDSILCAYQCSNVKVNVNACQLLACCCT